MSEEIKEPKIGRFWHELYINFQADPFDHRTDQQFCDDIALEVNTLRNWKQTYRPYIFKEVEARRSSYVNEIRSKGHKALAKKLDKDTNAIKLLFQLLGDLVEKTESRVEMSHDDQVRRVRSLLGSVGKRSASWDAAETEDKSEKGPEAIVPAEQKGPAGPTAP